jgi:hypothetical protein
LRRELVILKSENESGLLLKSQSAENLFMPRTVIMTEEQRIN